MSLLRPAKAIGELSTDVGCFVILYHLDVFKKSPSAHPEMRDFFLGVKDEIVTGTNNVLHYGGAMFLRPEGSYTYGEYVLPKMILITAE